MSATKSSRGQKPPDSKKTLTVVIIILVVAGASVGIGLGIYFSQGGTPAFIPQKQQTVSFIPSSFANFDDLTKYGWVSESNNNRDVFLMQEATGSRYFKVYQPEITSVANKTYPFARTAKARFDFTGYYVGISAVTTLPNGYMAFEFTSGGKTVFSLRLIDKLLYVRAYIAGEASVRNVGIYWTQPRFFVPGSLAFDNGNVKFDMVWSDNPINQIHATYQVPAQNIDGFRLVAFDVQNLNYMVANATLTLN